MGILFVLAISARADDPRTNCWLTTYSGQYARIYTNDAMKAVGTTLTTWSNSSLAQASPVYCGIQEIYSSSNWIYVRSTGLASYTMGPWYLNSGHTMLFPNLPVNQKLLFRFPRTNGVPTTKTISNGGQIGIFVDGVAMFNSWDGYYWNGTTNVQTGADNGYWNRDAYVNEGVTFDAGNAHQQNTGVYHYHADPIALRYELGDHVDYDPATKTYYEDTNAPTKHSPILAWTADGFPLYGPYGYSNPTNANSGIRRMVSGYVPRNGQNGTDNLDYLGAARTTIPAWAQRIFDVSASQSGPVVSTLNPFGTYMEDNDYLGDLTNSATGTNYQQGVDFDLDQYNGRWCVTPEFPNGTYAYFVAIDSNGVPVFPYDIGRAFYGDPVGSSVSAITETVTTNFLGGTNLTSTLNSPTVNNGTVTLIWSALEGGSYQVEATTNLSDSSDWTVAASDVSPDQITGGYTNITSADQNFYRVGRTSVATFDSAGTTLFATNSVAPGGSAYRGQTVNLTITLTSPPNLPPAGAPVTSVTVGGITNISATCTATGTVVSLFTIPSGTTATNAQNVVVTFGIPPGQSQAPTFTLTGGFTINP
ncbi:MAG TPA: YHYH protein [Candidatus Aquilonibacter sp.]|nr:YHYH protein [Candidatus Aquilonibacter sp.]